MIAVVYLSSLTIGALLASVGTALPLRPGVIGLLLMVAAALAARRHWLGMRLSAPGSPERALWIGLASLAIVLGHMLASLWQIGPALVLHSAAGHELGIDSWTLVAGGALAWWIARDPQPRRDERDRAIVADGLRWSYGSLIVLLQPVVFVLAFGDQRGMPALSRPLIAHLLIVAVLLSLGIGHARRLQTYRRDGVLD